MAGVVIVSNDGFDNTQTVCGALIVGATTGAYTVTDTVEVELHPFGAKAAIVKMLVCVLVVSLEKVPLILLPTPNVGIPVKLDVLSLVQL